MHRNTHPHHGIARQANVGSPVPLSRLLTPGSWLLAPLALLATVNCLLSSLSCTPKKESLPITADSVSVPYQQFTKATTYYYDGAFKKWKLEATHMRKNLDNRGIANIDPVRLTLYDSVGNVSTTVTADSGTTSGQMESFKVWGNVYITTDDHMIIKTQRLWWNKNARKVTSDTYVQITRGNGDVLRGRGLDAEEDFSRWSFRSNVTGVVPNFKDRIDGDIGF